MEETLKIALPMVGVLAGAAMQYLFQVRRETTKTYETQKTEAYLSYVRETCRAAVFQKQKSQPSYVEAMAALVHAKARVAVFGSEDVLSAVAAFTGGGECFLTKEQCDRFTAVIQSMRADLAPKQRPVIDRHVEALLFLPSGATEPPAIAG
jgi:hypothetical protein